MFNIILCSSNLREIFDQMATCFVLACQLGKRGRIHIRIVNLYYSVRREDFLNIFYFEKYMFLPGLYEV